jgi:pilus assembly protein TadC
VVPTRLLPPLLGLAVAGSVAVLSGGPGGAVLGIGLGVGVALGWPRLAARRAVPRPDPLSEAGAWDQMAACLRAGLPLERSVRAVVPVLPAAAGDALGRVADLLVLGADPATAWAPALDQPSTARLARAARRSARSGSAVAAVAEAHAVDVRAEAADAMAARAERAGVLVTGPLGLCFLPAFLALGIVPVVVGLAGPLLEQR